MRGCGNGIHARGYRKDGVIGGLSALIEALYRLNPYRSRGMSF